MKKKRKNSVEGLINTLNKRHNLQHSLEIYWRGLDFARTTLPIYYKTWNSFIKKNLEWHKTRAIFILSSKAGLISQTYEQVTKLI